MLPRVNRLCEQRRVGGPAARGAFTIVELAVVIAIITLLIALALPAFNTMSRGARLAQAVQQVNGLTRQAHIAAAAEDTLIAVRFVPGEWALDETAQAAADRGRQVAVTYRYVGTVEDPDDPNDVLYDERFERRQGSALVRLPPDVWVAPVEAYGLAGGGPTGVAQALLSGTIGNFELDPGEEGGDFLAADDFLIVFDPRGAVVYDRQAVDPGHGRPGEWRRYRLLAYDPEFGGERDRAGDVFYERFAFTGVVLYPREPFATLGTEADPQERQEVLRRFGRAYYVDRRGGVLVEGH